MLHIEADFIEAAKPLYPWQDKLKPRSQHKLLLCTNKDKVGQVNDQDLPPLRAATSERHQPTAKCHLKASTDRAVVSLPAPVVADVISLIISVVQCWWYSTGLYKSFNAAVQAQLPEAKIESEKGRGASLFSHFSWKTTATTMLKFPCISCLSDAAAAWTQRQSREHENIYCNAFELVYMCSSLYVNAFLLLYAYT